MIQSGSAYVFRYIYIYTYCCSGVRTTRKTTSEEDIFGAPSTAGTTLKWAKDEITERRSHRYGWDVRRRPAYIITVTV